MIFQEGDYYGQTVNVASRIAEYARPGEVLVSQEVVDASSEAGVTFREIGPVELKGVSGAMRLFAAHGPSTGGIALRTLLDLLDEAVAAYGDKTALSLRLDDGTTTTWTYRELDRRSRLAAWRLRALGLEPGDRLLTWSPSTPELPATYFGAMRAGLILVPLDLRMSSDAIEGIVTASGARHLILGTGRDAPDPREVGLERFPTDDRRCHRRGARCLAPVRLGDDRSPPGRRPVRTMSSSSSSPRARRAPRRA